MSMLRPILEPRSTILSLNTEIKLLVLRVVSTLFPNGPVVTDDRRANLHKTFSVWSTGQSDSLNSNQCLVLVNMDK